MRWKEKLHERPLMRPLDEPARSAISSLFQRRKHEIPIPAKLEWHTTRPELIIRSSWISFLVQFHADHMVVLAELSMAARLFATDENRRRVVQYINALADELNL
jgi:hypothetical protein